MKDGKCCNITCPQNLQTHVYSDYDFFAEMYTVMRPYAKTYPHLFKRNLEIIVEGDRLIAT